ncbi:uncharacterized protein DDB_G0286591 isoform X1 [Nasonia vitripennis]|uniref:Uncharacterized protein n=2 Tax=Nasonia vitripennis TaxID=7425 RepID=A0A7M7GH81_NASVI|nr:uncharacterized protein DDB_G0286591 isoform X1 [Nasonia vitripennis]
MERVLGEELIFGENIASSKMASVELEEKINKIRLQNEEIRRRYEEVEADKKHAAKQNALVQMVPSDDWPERKEPPEFSAPPKNVQKQKSLNKEHNDRLPQHFSSIQDRLGKKDHKFTQGNGPPPDPKYNFLADSEREMRAGDDGRTDEEKNRARNKASRGGPRRRGGDRGSSGGGSREAFFKDNRGPQAFHSKEESLPEYEAWRAERNRIDEARINRQKTAEGNWRREWDSNKTNIEKDSSRKGDLNRKDSNMYERRSNHYDSDYSNRGHGGSRTYHGSQKNHGHQDYRRPHHEQSHEYKRQPDNKPPLSPTEDRTVTASDKSIKVTVNPANQPKGPVMSVKVNSPSIAGTGRVGPRQKSRITYSSQSDAEGSNQEYNNFARQKSFDEKTAGANFNNGSKSAPKSPFTQRKKEGNSKFPYPQKKEFRNDESSTRSKNPTKSMYPQKTETKDQRLTNNSASKPQRNQKRNNKSAGDKLENLAFSNDDALPSEYQPDKSSNNATDLKSNNSDNIENIENVSNIVNAKDQVSLEESRINLDSDSFVKPGEPTNEIVSNYEVNTTCENDENNENIKEHCDHEEMNLNDSNADGNNQSHETEVEGSQNIDSNLIKKEHGDELQSASEPTSEEINSNASTIDGNHQSHETEIEGSDNIDSNLIKKVQEDELQISSKPTSEEINSNDSIVDGNNQSHETEVKGSENIDSNLIKKKEEDELQPASEPTNEMNQNVGLSDDTQQIIPQDIAVEQNSTSSSSAEEKSASTKIADSHQKVERQILEDEIQTPVPEKIVDEIKLSSDQEKNAEPIVHDGQNIGSQSEKDSTSQEVNNISQNENKSIDQAENKLGKAESDEIEQTNIEKESIKIDESKTVELVETSQNESINDSGLKDTSLTNESIELNDNDSQNTSADDSGIADDSNEVKSHPITSVSPIVVLDAEKNIENDASETMKSDFAEPTKEICEKTAKSCDISSAAPGQTSEAVKQETNETLGNPTKDSGVEVVKDANTIESSKPTDLQKEILSEKENPKTEESSKVATE